MTLEWIGLGIAALGIPFFVAGSAGLLRFPDLHARLHALSKADNLGVGLVTAGVLLTADSWSDVLKLALTWVVLIAGSATAGFLVANSDLEQRNRE